MPSGEIHECRQRRLAQFGRPSQRDLPLTIQFQGKQSRSFLRQFLLVEFCRLQERCRNLYVNAMHDSKLVDFDDSVTALASRPY